MRAVVVDRYGPPSVLRVVEADDPKPAADEVLVRVRLTNVNFRDVQERRGSYAARTRLPLVPGLEASGTIAALGADVTGFEVGQRVIAFAARGSYAELMPARAALTYPLPDGVADERVAGLTAAVTAENVLTLPGHGAAGRTVAVQSAAGGVGQLAVQLARAHGATRVVGRAAKVAAARAAGADVVIVRDGDEARRLRELTGGAGVDLVLNAVGGESVARDLGATAEFGAVVVFGQSCGEPGRVTTDALHKSSRALLGYSSGHLRQRRPERLRATVERVLRRIAAGELRVAIGGRFDLGDAARAHARVESGASTGKVLLDVSA